MVRRKEGGGWSCGEFEKVWGLKERNGERRGREMCERADQNEAREYYVALSCSARERW